MSQWTRARHPETGGEAIVPLDALPAMPYWEPVGEPADTQQELLVQIDQERVDAEDLEAEHVRKAEDAARDGRIDDVMAVVGDCAPAAEAALAVEQAKDKPRPTLVDQLEQIATGDHETEPAGITATTEGD